MSAQGAKKPNEKPGSKESNKCADVCVLAVDGLPAFHLKLYKVLRIGRRAGVEICIADESIEMDHGDVTLLSCGVVFLVAGAGMIFVNGEKKQTADIRKEDADSEGKVEPRFGNVKASLRWFQEASEEAQDSSGAEREQRDRSVEHDLGYSGIDSSLLMGGALMALAPPKEKEKQDTLLDASDLEMSALNWSASNSKCTILNRTKADRADACITPDLSAPPAAATSPNRDISTPDFFDLMVADEQELMAAERSKATTPQLCGIKQLVVATIETPKSTQNEEDEEGRAKDQDKAAGLGNKENIPQATTATAPIKSLCQASVEKAVEAKNISGATSARLSQEDQQLKAINKYVRQAKGNRKLKITFDMCNRQALESVIRGLKPVLEVTEDPLQCDLLVMDKGERTYKFLTAVAANKPVLHSQWLQSIKKYSNTISVPKKDLFKDSSFEKLFKFDPLRVLENPQLFKGFSFLLCEGIQPNATEMKAIIECAAGRVYAKPPPLLDSPHLYVVTTENDTRTKRLLRAHNVVFIKTEGVMQSLVQHQVQLLDEHQLKL